jgi:hypothetical protein
MIFCCLEAHLGSRFVRCQALFLKIKLLFKPSRRCEPVANFKTSGDVFKVVDSKLIECALHEFLAHNFFAIFILIIIFDIACRFQE